jgi:hypothetical protein
VFDGWLGDSLVESFPCYVVTEALADRLAATFSGFALDDVETSASEQFRELHPRGVLPKFRWLRVTGIAGVDDFGMASDHRLVVSQRALDLVRASGAAHLDVVEMP